MIFGMMVAMLLSSALFAQTPSNVKVTVMDSDGNPLVGVGVVVAGSVQGGVTDFEVDWYRQKSG